MKVHAVCSQKFAFVWLAVFFAIVMSYACSSSKADEMVEEPEKEDPFVLSCKGRLAYEGDTMRVLILGNSFSADATTYLKEVADGAGLDRNRFCVYNAMISGGGMADWIETLENATQQSIYRMAGAIKMNTSGPLVDVLKQPWDVCLLLQNSDASYKWDSFENTLPRLIETIKNLCPNSNLLLAYMLPWSHTLNTNELEWTGNIACAKRIAKDYDITVIPIGTAIQNARCQGLDNGMYLTRDNWHLCNGVGKFIAASTLYEGLLSTFAKRSILDNPVVYTLSADEAEAKGAMMVDMSNERICKLCAYWAVEKPFEVTSIW